MLHLCDAAGVTTIGGFDERFPLSQSLARGYALTGTETGPGRQMSPVAGHPDLVLARAVSHGVVSSDDAELVGTSRLTREPLDQIARRLGLTYAACRKRWARAERRLVRFLGHAGVRRTSAAATAAA